MNTRERILEYTKYEIKNTGIKKLSGRAICNALGINVSSIKYHFGDKDCLIQEALMHITSEVIPFTDLLYAINKPLAERLYNFLQKFQELIISNPDVVRFILKSKAEFPIGKNASQSNETMKYIICELEKLDICLNEMSIRIRMLQIVSALAYPAELGLFKVLSAEDNSLYLQSLVRLLMGKEII